MQSIRRHWWAFGTAAVLLAWSLVSVALGRSPVVIVGGNILALLGMFAMTAAAARNIPRMHGQSKIFWILIFSGLFLWTSNQALWTWYEVVLRKPLPDPFVGDIILFMHLVPFMAAIALRPHRARDEHKLHFSTLSFLMLLLWWVFVYTFVVYPEEYIAMNVDVYSRSYDRLYFIENLLTSGVLGAAALAAQKGWRKVYWNLFLASALYALASESMNAAIARGLYFSGSLYDIPFLASVSWFFWTALQANGPAEDFAPAPAPERAARQLAPRLAMLAMLSLPLLALIAFYDKSMPESLRNFRLITVCVTLLGFGIFIFLKQYLLDRELIFLLEASHSNFDNLQRLQTEVVQQEKLASLGELVAGAAHELRHPLTSILGFSELLSSSVSLGEDQREMAQKIHHQALRTNDLVSDLLSFAQQAPAEKSLIDIGTLLHRVVHTQMIKVEGRKIEIKLTAAPNLPKVNGNNNQLFMAFLEIITNAIDAVTEDGGGTVLVSAHEVEDEIVLEFSDSGPGIREPKRVFDPFYTTKPIGKGTGLGLSATYGVMQDHGGHISCYNKPERGAVFVVRLPAASREQRAVAWATS
ncbi:MAG TPA: ATP-binding protein [Terriglobales bacterium]|jgi:signal transduction histidine kinase|nr:ATP-binding protein [Terriglobales bacterium]